jgi:hypothetical protein
MELIYPRSPREVMSGWIYLPRFVDKIRLHLAGKLHPDYQENFSKKGFDAMWLDAAGIPAATLIEVVGQSLTDGQVADWVRCQVKRTEAEKAAHREKVLAHGRQDEAMCARLKMRKEQSGMAHRDDIQCFVDYIDADEGRL